eukprot:7336688-Alexandrium_andersonii.AAC.1
MQNCESVIEQAYAAAMPQRYGKAKQPQPRDLVPAAKRPAVRASGPFPCWAPPPPPRARRR